MSTYRCVSRHLNMKRALSIPGYANAFHYDVVTSTMEVAREMLGVSCVDASWHGLVTADEQTAGRGRQGRSWISTAGAFMGTFVFGTERPVTEMSGYSLAVGVAIAETLQELGIEIKLKWPNDLVVTQEDRVRKLGGILIEVQELGAYRSVLVGIGINNANQPEEMGDSVASLAALRGSPVPSDELTRALALGLLAAHESFVRGRGFAEFVQRWRTRSCFVRGVTSISIDGGGALEGGLFLDVTETGALILEVDGKRKVYHSGHIHSVTL